MSSLLEKYTDVDKPNDLIHDLVVDITRPEITNAEVNHRYEIWAETYDRDMDVNGFVGPQQAGEEIAKVLGDHYDAVIGDFACGTGNIAQQMIARGYTNIEGIDGNPGMLAIANKKNVYKKVHVGYLLKDTKIESIPDNTYDAMITCGTFVPGHLDQDCFEELIRIAKPGSRIVFFVRDRFLTGSSKLSDLPNEIKRLEAAGKWREISRHTRTEYHGEDTATVFIMEPLPGK